MTRWTHRSISSQIFFKYRKLSYLATILLSIFLIAAYIRQNGINEYSRYNWLQGNRELLSVYNSDAGVDKPNGTHPSSEIDPTKSVTSSPASAKCSPKSNIVFIKTHKCASSTVQNIFMRYGVANRKVFVLPSTANYLGHPLPFNRSMVPNPNHFHHEYNILTHHSRLNYTEMSELMPNDTLFITILRNPVDLFESMFNYYRLYRFWNITLDSFSGEEFDIPEKVRKTRYVGKIGINQMMFDLGVSADEFIQPDVIRQYVNHFDSIFDLVMLSERMDESLVLLKHLLCWSTDDVVVFKLNARESSSKSNLTEAVRSQLATLNWADSQLYKHFKRKFAFIVSAFGEERMKEEVNELRERTKQWFDYCVSDNRSAANMTAKNTVAIVRHINKQRNNSTCWLMTAQEMDFTKYLRIRQMREFPGSVFTPTVAPVRSKKRVSPKLQQHLKRELLRINPQYAGLWCKKCVQSKAV